MGGRRPEKVLNAAFVKSVQEPGKYFDGHGLYLRVEPNGTRFWVQRIAIRGKRTELGLGSPSLVSLKEAAQRFVSEYRCDVEVPEVTGALLPHVPCLP
jgi:hypothetical protein